MTTAYLGIDIGTSSLKALAIGEDGAVLARSSVPYQASIRAATRAGEQDPRLWLDAARRAIADCLATAGTPAGIGLTGQVPTLVLADASGHVPRPALTWQDARANAEAEELASEIGASFPHIGMELPWSPAHLPAKLRWLAKHEPGLTGRGLRALQPKDYLGWALTGDAVSDAWSVKGIGDIRTGLPAAAVLTACGWPAEVCPPTAPPWSSRGVTHGQDFGLPEGIPVSVGWSDALCSMLAIGVFDKPTAFILTGTSEIVGLSTRDATDDAPGLYRVPLECAPRNVLYGPTQSSGASALWAAALLGVPVDELPSLAAGAASRTGPVFVPYISGERAPLWRPDIRGVIAGIDASDGRAELARAVLSGISLSAADILDVASTAAGDGIDTIHIAGRGAANGNWGPIRLRTLGARVCFHPEPFVAALGAAMLGHAAAHGGELAGDLDRLRREPVVAEPSADDIAHSKAALADYRDVSAFAQSWRTP